MYEYKIAPISIQREAKYLSDLPHLHKEIEIVYVEQGSTLAFADTETYRLSTGDIFISFPDQIHYYTQCERGEYRVLIVTPQIFFGIKDVLDSQIPESNVVSLSAEDPMVTMIKEIIATSDENISAQVGRLNLLMSLLLPRMKFKPAIGTENSTMHSILGFCSRHFAEDISLEFVADSLHLSRCYISHLFSKSLNIGFNEYINMLRVRAACDILIRTQNKISDISGEVGFGSIRSFNRAFVKLKKCTPQEYRARVKKK